MSIVKSVSHLFYYFEWISPKIFGVLANLEDREEVDKKEETKKTTERKKTKEELKREEQKRKKLERLREKETLAKILSLDLSFRDVRHLALVTRDREVFDTVASFLVEANQLKINNYVNIDLIFKTVMRGRDINNVFRIAKMFKNTKLDEVEGFADFERLILYINIPDIKLLEMTYAMVESKNIGYQLRQKDLIRFYDSNKPFSENIHDFGQALMFAKKNKLDLDINDFIIAMINHREPFQFVNNFYNIEKHALTIPKRLFCSVNISQETMTEFIELYISAREQKIDLDFNALLKDYKINKNLKRLIKYLIRFKNEDIEEIDYEKLFYYEELNGDIKSMLEAYTYAKNKDLVFENLYEKLTKFLSGLDVGVDKKRVNALNFVKAIYFGESNFNISRKKIMKDYHSGIDVLALFYTMNYANLHGLKIDYIPAKIANSIFEGGLDKAVQKALNPFTIKGKQINVTTKDNIEIVVEINIVVLLNIYNLTKGSNEDIIIDRANNIFVEETQNRYNHNEIVKNINVISEIIILRLKGEMTAEVRENIAFHMEESHGHGGHGNSHDKGHNKKEGEACHFHINYERENEIQKKYNKVSKFIPKKILIPKIGFDKDTFKAIELAKEEFEIHKHKAEAEVEKIRADIKIKEAWAKEGNLKYYFLKEEKEDDRPDHK